MRQATLVLGFAASAYGHGAITYPLSRNAVDANEAPWNNTVPGPDVPFEPWCPYPSAVGSDKRNLTGANGQACFWFSNGCAIGCPACDGSTRGPIPKFDCKPGHDSKNCDLVPDPKNPHMEFGPKAPICKSPLNATVCDPKQRTVNTGAECGSDEDYFFYSPWRRPGSAPVIDVCGTAGGRIPGQGDGGFGASYVNTTHARVGDRGSLLAATPSVVQWKAGDVVEVAWTLQANHGGGYSYRLCPASSPLTEACMQKTPLDFVGQSALRWGGVGGRTVYFDATYVTGAQSSPQGSMWAKNPVPRAWKDASGNWGQGSNHLQTGYGFQPVCEDEGMDKTGSKQSCTGMWGPFNMEIVDKVQIPKDLPAGEYVLGWRYDCEESNQIWSSCSDVAIVA